MHYKLLPLFPIKTPLEGGDMAKSASGPTEIAAETEKLETTPKNDSTTAKKVGLG